MDLGVDLGNVDVLVHFVGVKGEPCEIRNVAPDKFGVYYVIDDINSFAKDLDKDVVSMFAKNENCRYIHLYVIRNKDEFWHEPRLVAPVVNETINEGINEHVPIVEDDVGSNENCPMQIDEACVSDKDVAYEGFSEGSSSDNEYSPFDEHAESTNGDALSDFDESVDVIGVAVVHSNSDMEEIYEENRLHGKQFELDNDGKICFEIGHLFLNVTHFREVLKGFGIQEGFGWWVKNEKCRVTIECKDDDCIWRIHASLVVDKETY
ncbi:hypothetical protein JHK86_010122 [Glycine max]|nr:hypothetical protein JHK86_010122 [Glycine max]